MSHILRETSNLKHHIACVWFDITCTLYIVRTCNTGLKCQFAMFCEDMWFVGLVGNHGDNNPTFAKEKTNKRFGEKPSKASRPDALQSTSINHEWNGNTLLFVKENSRTNNKSAEVSSRQWLVFGTPFTCLWKLTRKCKTSAQQHHMLQFNR